MTKSNLFGLVEQQNIHLPYLATFARTRLTLAVMAAGAAFVASTPTAAEAWTCKDGESDTVQAVTDGRQLSQIIGVHSCWSANVENGKHQYLNDLYGRWVMEQITSDKPDNLVRDYKSEKRSPLARFFVGKSNGSVISVKLRMRDPDVEFTIPIVAVNYNGKSREGEAFITNVTTSEMGFPDFRISANSSVSVEASARLTDEVDVQSANIVLSAVRDSLSIAAPAGSLLTSVNRDQVQRVATAYDSALSKLLSTTISESMSAGRLLSEWYPGASFLVSVEVPSSIRTLGDNAPRAPGAHQQRRIMFRVGMACPRLSVFDTVSACESGTTNVRSLINSPYRDAGRNPRQVIGEPGFTSETYKKIASDLFGRVNANQVLSFRLGVGKTLRQFLTEQEWFLSLSKKMVDISPLDKSAAEASLSDKEAGSVNRNKKAPEIPILAADEFCTAVVDKLFSAGLSRLDSQIGLWALATGVPDFAASRSVFQAAPRCTEQLPAKVWTYAPTV